MKTSHLEKQFDPDPDGDRLGKTMTVAILCAARKSAYKNMKGVEVYDIDRDARTFSGGMPIVAHPPCRGWSKWLWHQAKPEPGEKELGLWCCDQLRECGGVLEQPAGSKLFFAAGFPDSQIWMIEVWQAWWGYPTKKSTWLAFCGIDPATVNPPFRLHPRGRDGKVFENMSRAQRAHTTPEFAEWLVSIARRAQ